MQRKIAIIGTGYVGLTTGICLACLGHNVICVDKDKSKIEKLRQGIIPIFEPGLDEYLKKYRKNIAFTRDLKEAIKRSEVIFIAVGTPSQKDGSIDITYFKNAVREISGLINEYKIIYRSCGGWCFTGDYWSFNY